MKRFMLVGLMSCMFVGQLFCAGNTWTQNTKEFVKGVSLGTISTGLAAVASVPLVVGLGGATSIEMEALRNKILVHSSPSRGDVFTDFYNVYNIYNFSREWEGNLILKYGTCPELYVAIPAATAGCGYIYNLLKGLPPILRRLEYNSDVTGAEFAHASGRVIGSTAVMSLVVAGLMYVYNSAHN
jgi:hypothetical protein